MWRETCIAMFDMESTSAMRLQRKCEWQCWLIGLRYIELWMCQAVANRSKRCRAPTRQLRFFQFSLGNRVSLCNAVVNAFFHVDHPLSVSLSSYVAPIRQRATVYLALSARYWHSPFIATQWIIIYHCQAAAVCVIKLALSHATCLKFTQCRRHKAVEQFTPTFTVPKP